MEVYKVKAKKPRSRYGQKVAKVLQTWGLPLLIGAICVMLLVATVGFQFQRDRYKRQASAEKKAGQVAVKNAVKETAKKVTAKVKKEQQESMEKTLEDSEKLLQTVNNLQAVVKNMEATLQADGIQVDGAGKPVTTTATKPGGEGTEGPSPNEKWKWILDTLVKNKAKEEAANTVNRDAALTASMQSYMRDRGFKQGLIDLAPLMVQLAKETGNDARICPVTALYESTGGRGSSNLFGVLGNSISGGSIEAQVRFYFKQITSYGFNGDVYGIAFKWYDSSDPGGRSTSYASNVTGEVQSIRF